MRFAAVAGLVALAAPIARGEFSCYEWPSKSDPMANVAYLIATDCDADMTALSKASGFSHLQEFGQADYTESSCTNSAGMVYFADLCNQTAAALVSIATPASAVCFPCHTRPRFLPLLHFSLSWSVISKLCECTAHHGSTLLICPLSPSLSRVERVCDGVHDGQARSP